MLLYRWSQHCITCGKEQWSAILTKMSWPMSWSYISINKYVKSCQQLQCINCFSHISASFIFPDLISGNQSASVYVLSVMRMNCWLWSGDICDTIMCRVNRNQSIYFSHYTEDNNITSPSLPFILTWHKWQPIILLLPSPNLTQHR